jgi:prepilin-type N-terminal cleavage/methylation domain-containing protein
MRDEELRRRIGRVRGSGKHEGGFTLIEFLIAVAILAPVLGASVILATQLQRVYGSRLDDATVEEEVRFSVDWIAQALRNAGSNPYSIGGFEPIDVNEDGTSIRVLADVNPPDGLTTSANEDLTIAFDAGERVITRDDNSVVADPEQMTEPVIAGLLFTLFDSNGNQLDDGEEGSTAYVRVRVTGRSPVFSPTLGGYPETTLETEVRVRTR